MASTSHQHMITGLQLEIQARQKIINQLQSLSPGSSRADMPTTAAPAPMKRTRHISAAQKKKLSDAAKARWAAKKVTPAAQKKAA